MTLRAEIVALVLMESEIELSTVLNHRTVERRQKNMILVIELWYGNNEQTMILTRIAVNECRTAIGTRTVCSK